MATESCSTSTARVTSCYKWKRVSFIQRCTSMEQSGWINSEWALTETGRRAKYYRLTAAGRKQLNEAEASFERLVKGVRAMLRYA